MLIKIRMIQEMAITASLGVAVDHLHQPGAGPGAAVVRPPRRDLPPQAQAAAPPHGCAVEPARASGGARKVALPIVVVAGLLFAFGWWKGNQVKIGDLHPGVPELHADSRYNIDTDVITQPLLHRRRRADGDRRDGAAGLHRLRRHARPSTASSGRWRNVPACSRCSASPTMAKVVNAGWNEGSLKWRVLPRNPSTMSQAVTYIDTSTGLLNTRLQRDAGLHLHQRPQGRDHRRGSWPR